LRHEQLSQRKLLRPLELSARTRLGGLGDASRGEKLDIRHVPEEGERHRDARLYDVEDTIAAKSRSERETAATTPETP